MNITGIRHANGGFRSSDLGVYKASDNAAEGAGAKGSNRDEVTAFSAAGVQSKYDPVVSNTVMQSIRWMREDGMNILGHDNPFLLESSVTLDASSAENLAKRIEADVDLGLTPGSINREELAACETVKAVVDLARKAEWAEICVALEN